MTKDTSTGRAGTPRPSGPRTVVVTGASSGIGRGTALALAAQGDTVVLAARRGEVLEELAAECRALGAEALAVPTDVSDEQAVQALADRAVAAHGRVDAWVNAAAVWSYGRFEDTPAHVFRQVVDTTLMGQVHAARAVLPTMRRQGRGVLVNVSSLYGVLSTPYVSPYVTAKWGLVGFSEVLRQELRDAPGIDVCLVLPGAVDTPVYRHAANYVGREIRPLPPVVAPQRVVDAVLGLLDRPRRQVVVGRTQHLGVALHDLAPWAWDRLVGPVVHLGALRRAPQHAHDGTVLDPHGGPGAAAPAATVDDGWRRHDRRTAGAVLGAAVTGAAALAGTTVGTLAALRRRAR